MKLHQRPSWGAKAYLDPRESDKSCLEYVYVMFLTLFIYNEVSPKLDFFPQNTPLESPCINIQNHTELKTDRAGLDGHGNFTLTDH